MLYTYTWREKLCCWILYRSLWSSGTQNPLAAEESLSQALGCNLNSFIIVNKENPSSICVLNVSHILWFDKYLCFSILYTIYLTWLYICIILYLKIDSWQVKEKHPWRLWRRSRAEEDKARIDRHVSSESILSSYFLFCTLESIACKFYEYVGNPRPSVIRCLFLYNSLGSPVESPVLLYRNKHLITELATPLGSPDCCRLFLSPLTSLCLEVCVWCFILVHAYYSVWNPCGFFLFFEKTFVPVRGLLYYTVTYRGFHTRVALLDSHV